MSVKESKRLRVHRFRDYVAVLIGDSETLYLSPVNAQWLAAQLGYCAYDVQTKEFTKSIFKTVDTGE